MSRTLNVYLRDRHVGDLVQDDYGELVFDYAASWLGAPEAVPLSHSLPLQAERFSSRECKPYFGGILPEGGNREVVARNLGISARNDFAMLEQIGGECAGAVTFIPAGESLPERDDRYRPITDSELANILRGLPRRPLLAGDEGVRVSLAGAQNKLAVHYAGGVMSIPLSGAPSTHIIKPAISGYDGIVFNEAYCMRLARASGLPVAKTEARAVEEIDYLMVERYDRTAHAAKSTERLHQEDFCQALGVLSENKYQNEGGPSLPQCFQLVRDISSLPVGDLSSLLNVVVFNFLIGNNDAHGKNFSLLYSNRSDGGRRTRLAPFYDLFSTVYYPDLSTSMAMKIGGEYRSERIAARHFDRFAEEAGLGQSRARRRLLAFTRSMMSILDVVGTGHPVEVTVAGIVRERCERTLEMFAA